MARTVVSKLLDDSMKETDHLSTLDAAKFFVFTCN